MIWKAIILILCFIKWCFYNTIKLDDCYIDFFTIKNKALVEYFLLMDILIISIYTICA